MRMLSLAVAVYSLGVCPKTAGAKGEPTPLIPEMTPGSRRLCGTGNFANETSARASSYGWGEDSASVFAPGNVPPLTGLDIIGQSIPCALDAILKPHGAHG